MGAHAKHIREAQMSWDGMGGEEMGWDQAHAYAKMRRSTTPTPNERSANSSTKSPKRQVQTAAQRWEQRPPDASPRAAAAWWARSEVVWDGMGWDEMR